MLFSFGHSAERRVKPKPRNSLSRTSSSSIEISLETTLLVNRANGERNEILEAETMRIQSAGWKLLRNCLPIRNSNAIPDSKGSSSSFLPRLRVIRRSIFHHALHHLITYSQILFARRKSFPCFDNPRANSCRASPAIRERNQNREN